MTTATKIFQPSKFGLPNLAFMYLNPGRSACPPFLNKVYKILKGLFYLFTFCHTTFTYINIRREKKLEVTMAKRPTRNYEAYVY